MGVTLKEGCTMIRTKCAIGNEEPNSPRVDTNDVAGNKL